MQLTNIQFSVGSLIQVAWLMNSASAQQKKLDKARTILIMKIHIKNISYRYSIIDAGGKMLFSSSLTVVRWLD